jgi:hypothetical protein
MTEQRVRGLGRFHSSIWIPSLGIYFDDSESFLEQVLINAVTGQLGITFLRGGSGVSSRSLSKRGSSRMDNRRGNQMR